MTHGFSIAQTALVVPVVVFLFTLLDVFDSRQLPELFDDPLLGQSVTAFENFRAIDNHFEGRVLLNGATWNARCNERQLEEGDCATVSVRDGQFLKVV